MGWASLLIALLDWLGPILVKLVQDWLRRRLEMAAEALPAMETYGTEAEARDALFDRAIADLPPWANQRRKFLRRAKVAAAVAGVSSQHVPQMGQSDAEELSDLAGNVVAGW